MRYLSTFSGMSRSNVTKTEVLQVFEGLSRLKS